MAKYEKYSIASLITTGLIFFYLQMKMLDGASLVNHPPEALFWIYITIIAMFIITEIINAVLFLTGSKVAEDERDFAIKAKAGRNGDFVVMALINVVIFTVLANYAFTEYHGVTFDITQPASLFFHLVGILIIGTIVERISAIVYYRL